MKRILLVTVMVLLVATAVSAQLPPKGYVGFFADVGRSSWCITGMGSFTLYFFALPPQGGMDCVEIRSVLSSGNIAVFNPVYHADVLEPVMGGVPGDLAACFGNCWYNWVQVFSATIFIMAATPETVSIAPFTGSPYPKILDCLVPANEKEAIPFTYLYTNTSPCPPIGNSESTWGAIKSLYR